MCNKLFLCILISVSLVQLSGCVERMYTGENVLYSASDKTLVSSGFKATKPVVANKLANTEIKPTSISGWGLPSKKQNVKADLSSEGPYHQNSGKSSGWGSPSTSNLSNNSSNSWFPGAKKSDAENGSDDTSIKGTNYALVIGNDNYLVLPKLKTARRDAQAVASILDSKYNFKTTLLLDSNRAEVLDQLSRFREKLLPGDNFLVYYAGHGWLDSEVDRGYWIPIDADRTSKANWISNVDVTDELRAIKAKHIMLIADSCYSGKLTRGLRLGVRSAGYITKLLSKKSRTVLTSGGIEPVEDGAGNGHSVFAKAFLDALTENQGAIDGQTLFTKIRRPVMLNSNQTPEYGDIRLIGHDGGDFVFFSTSGS